VGQPTFALDVIYYTADDAISGLIFRDVVVVVVQWPPRVAILLSRVWPQGVYLVSCTVLEWTDGGGCE
jgi:hypothetical protein